MDRGEPFADACTKFQPNRNKGKRSKVDPLDFTFTSLIVGFGAVISLCEYAAAKFLNCVVAF